ncbi:MAG TPA: hypothetical protein VIF15_22050 [Polyangiaceae bacterium]|jgi:hypothetical protein
MRTARALAPAALVVACAACTYVIPGLAESDAGSSGDDAGDGALDDSSGGGDDASTAETGEAGGNGGDGATPEANPNVDAACTGLLCACNNGSDCASRICAAQLTVGAALYHAAGDASFCTQPCCSSIDCAPGTVCFGSGQGGSYCVNPVWLGRTGSPGSLQGGSSCSSDTQCRSGLCAGTCADTCCSMAQGSSACANQCVFGTFPGKASLDTHFTAQCGTGGPGQYSTGCTDGTQCQGGLCFANGCTNPCHSPGECGGGNACQLDFQGNDIYAACFPTTSTETNPEGATCSNDNQCLGDWCGTTTNKCTNICIGNSDCAAVPGWYCRPEEDTTPNGTFNVLVCGP